MADEPLTIDIADGVAWISFADVARSNPIDDAFCQAFDSATLRVTADYSVRAIVLRSTGERFSVGGDLKSFDGPQAGWADNIRRWTGLLNASVMRLQTCDAPTIVLVDGICAGGMTSLVAGCDFVLTSSRARFAAAYAGIAFSCDVGASVMLPRRMGVARAKRFLLLNETLDANQALAAGLVDEMVDTDDLARRADALAKQLARGPTRTYGEIRRLLVSGQDQALKDQLADEAEALARMVATSDVAEGLTAFAERRLPTFTASRGSARLGDS